MKINPGGNSLTNGYFAGILIHPQLSANSTVQSASYPALTADKIPLMGRRLVRAMSDIYGTQASGLLTFDQTGQIILKRHGETNLDGAASDSIF